MSDTEPLKPVEAPALLAHGAKVEESVLAANVNPIAGVPQTDTEQSSIDDFAESKQPVAANQALVTNAASASNETSKATWPTLSEDHPLSRFLSVLPQILESTSHNEVYGLTLKSNTGNLSPDFHTLLILQKFLRANQNDLPRAQEQLEKTLRWRKEFDPRGVASSMFNKEKFNGLGYVVVVPKENRSTPPVVTTWNIYGAVKDYEKTFVPVEEFLRWRIGLMEYGVTKLNLANARAPIPDYGQGSDPYQGIQVHDYRNVSFLRMDSRAKAASNATIKLLGDFYPETLSRKFFVNIPTIMGWLYAAMKLLVSAETTKKFVVLSDGSYVAGELDTSVPNEYGGNLGALHDVGAQLKLE